MCVLKVIALFSVVFSVFMPTFLCQAQVVFPECEDQQVDLVLVVGSSDTVLSSGFQHAKDFLSRVVEQLPVSNRGVRVALLRFTSATDVMVELRDTNDVTSILDAIAGMEYVTLEPGAEMNTDKALRMVKDKILRQHKDGSRVVVAVLTDTENADRSFIKFTSRRLRKEFDARLLWLYVTTDRDVMGMMREAKERREDGDVTFIIHGYDNLNDDISTQVVNATCQETIDVTELALEEATTTATPDDDTPDSPSSGDTTSTSSSPTTPTSSTTTGSSPATQDALHTSGTVDDGSATMTTILGLDDLISDEQAVMTSSPGTKTPAETTTPYGEDDDLDIEIQTVPTPTQEASSDPRSQQSDNSANSVTPSVVSATGSVGESGVPGTEDGGGAFEDNPMNIIGITVGLVALAAVTSGLVNWALVRRRRKRDKYDTDHRL